MTTQPEAAATAPEAEPNKEPEPSPFWQINKTMAEASAYMLENQLRCDVTFSLMTSEGMTKTIGAHQFVLTSRSPVFETMLSERWSTDDDVIKLDDVEYDVMKEFLKFVYTGECKLSAGNVLPMQYLAKKYMIASLEERCAFFVGADIGVENVCTLLQQGMEFHDRETQKLCLSFIKDNTNSVFNSRDFLNASRDALTRILASEIFSCENGEEDVYTACVKWGRHQVALDAARDDEDREEKEVKEVKEEKEKEGAEADCAGGNTAAGTEPEVTDEQVREKLGRCLYMIRLPALTLVSLVPLLGSSCVVSYAEKGMLHERAHRKSAIKDMPFPVRPRRFSLRINRFDFPYSILYTTSAITNPVRDAIHFSTSRDVLLYGVTFQASTCGRLPTGVLKLAIDEDDVSEAQLHGGSHRKLGVKFPVRRIPANQVVLLEVTWDERENDDLSYRFPVYFDQRGYEPNRVSVEARDGTVFSFVKQPEPPEPPDALHNTSTVTHGQFPQLMFFSTLAPGPPFLTSTKM